MTKWSIPRMWEGGECWIIGGGPSMPQQFGVPEEVINQVLAGKVTIAAYSPYLSPLHAKHVIGVNVAYILGNWISVCYFGDRSFIRNHGDALHGFPNLKVTHANPPKRYNKWMKGVKKLNSNTKEGFSDNPRTVHWNKSSGAAAINFAVLAGAKRILLLGFDMRANPATYTHWHHYYLDERNFKVSQKCFDRYLTRFPGIAQAAKERGVEILNVCKNSAIEAFPKVELKEVL